MNEWVLPPARAEIAVPLSDGSTIALRRLGNAHGPRLFLSHGNGFAADGYLPFWGELAAGFDLLVFDFRNHGRNERSDPRLHCYAQMVDDLDRVIAAGQAAFGDVPAIGVFHSMSARTAMKHGLERAWRWVALALFDPPNVPPRGHALYPAMEEFETRLVASARARRALFDDPAELVAAYRRAPGSRGWVAGAHELMAQTVLRQEPAGWRLVCAPELEAAIYGEATTLGLWPEASRYPGPVLLVGADPERGPATGPANRALGQEGGFDYTAIPGAGHMLQIEQPEACRAVLLDFLARHAIRAAS